jgi:hypothetical protein
MFHLCVVRSNLHTEHEINMKFSNYYFFLFFTLISCSAYIFVYNKVTQMINHIVFLYIYIMNINRLFRSILIVLFIIWLPLVSTAGETSTIHQLDDTVFYQDKKDKKQEQGKKPEVKEVPQSRKQEKPEEVKSDKKDDRSKERKGKN